MKLKSYFSFLLLCFFSVQMSAQIVDPIKWNWKAEALGNSEYNLVFTATLDKGWNIYSQYLDDGGPIPTSFIFEKNKEASLIGKTTEKGNKTTEGMDDLFGIVVKKFGEKAVFTQKVKVENNTTIKGSVEFMVCDNIRCMPPDTKEFEFELTANKSTAITPVVNEPSATAEPTPEAASTDELANATNEDIVTPSNTSNTPDLLPAPPERFGTPVTNCGAEIVEPHNQTLWQILILGFLGGLIALLTPCVFPMIPLTVSFFTKRSENPAKGKAEAIFYAFSIIFIYFLFSAPFLVFDVSPDTLNEISTGAPLNIFFFLIFVIFAFSFFGYYEITLPSFLANKVDSASHVGGIIGIFFMALTLAIVSFSCTGPIIGSLLVGAITSSGGKLNLVVGMTSFGLALALPFGLFAFFPRMLKSLPKSGGWMTTVKVVLGFIELIFAFKFLSNADLVMHWGLLKYEVFLIIWAVLGLGLFLYLIGKIRFPHDSPLKSMSKTRMAFAALSLAFVLYTSAGLFGMELKIFSGFPPPKFYSLAQGEAKIPAITNYEEALALAQKEGKPVMIDFTGWACVNCRKMEENVWTDPAVFSKLKEQYVLASLYVDDRDALPENEQYVSKFSGKKVKTIGNKWSDMQAQYFNSNTQPFYVLVSPDEKLLTPPVGYTPNKEEYLRFLDCGLEAMKKLQTTARN